MKRGGRKKSGVPKDPDDESCYFDDRDLLFTKPYYDYKDGAGKAKVTTPPYLSSHLLDMEATEELFRRFDLLRSVDFGPKLIDPVTKLDDCKRYGPPTTSKAEDGPPLQLQLRMIQQWPNQQEEWRPLFELTNLSQSYADMEREMQTSYDSFTSGHIMLLKQVHKNFYGVIEVCDEDQTVLFKRIRVIQNPMKFPDGTPHTVEVELIDDHFITSVCSQDTIFYLDKSFAALPPRVTSIQMEGMSNYKSNSLFRRFVMRTSDEFLFEGELIAEVQPGGKVLVWSEQFPRVTFPYGINGFITQSMIELTQGKVPRLLSVGDFQDDVSVVHADCDGFIWVRFQNDISAHLREICDSISPESLVAMRGAVTLAEISQSNLDHIYFAPRAMSQGTYYRAVVNHSKERKDDMVQVKFIDHGDTDYVAVKDLIKAGEVHYLLPFFPPIAVHVHLQNIWGLEAPRYLEQINSGQEKRYTLQVIKGASDEDPAEVIMFPFPNPLQSVCLNYKLAKAGLAEEIDPFYVYGGRYWNPQEVRWSFNLKLYLGMGNGHRLMAGEVVHANISYDGTMRAFLFLTPAHRVTKREDLEVQVRNSYEQQPQIFPWTVVPGAGVICDSLVLMRQCRAIVIKEVKATVPLDGGEAMSKRWRVYLVDYGILELVRVSEMRMLKPAHLDLPALGVRIKLRKLPTKEAVREWWMKAVGKLEMGIWVKIISISSDQSGEIAEVSFPTMEIPDKRIKEGESPIPGSTSTRKSGGDEQEPFPNEDKDKGNPSGAEVTPPEKKGELEMVDKPGEAIVAETTPKERKVIFVPGRGLSSSSDSEDGHMVFTFSNSL